MIISVELNPEAMTILRNNILDENRKHKVIALECRLGKFDDFGKMWIDERKKGIEVAN